MQQSAVHCASFNLHFQETFFVSIKVIVNTLARLNTFNLHFQETFFVSRFCSNLCTINIKLSISIFRRLSLFLPELREEGNSTLVLSISIFRRLSLFHVIIPKDDKLKGKTFNLHFQETFFVSYPRTTLHL